MTLVDMAVERAEGRSIRRLRVEVGALAAIDMRSMEFCFEVCAKDTPLEGAELLFESVKGRARCRACNADVELTQPYGECPCGSLSLDITGGQSVRLLDMEIL
jgi:hydrogenase nickel incorporation protein HypA/HybF